MNEPATANRKSQLWGWILVLVVTVLLVLNGASWYFIGPASSVESMAEKLGLTPAEFLQDHPEAADLVRATARLVSVWFTAFGVFGALVALEGRRNGRRGVWTAAWTIPAALAGVGILESGGGFGTVLLVLASVAAAGLLMSRPGAASGVRTGT